MQQSLEASIFKINTTSEFDALALKVFEFQYHTNSIYKRYCDLIGVNVNFIKTPYQIPFLPIEFFKNHKIVSTTTKPEIEFTSSGTTATGTSKHLVSNLRLYEQSFIKGFEYFYGPIEEYCILALLPAYLERQGSSLIYMVESFMQRSKHLENGFFLYNHDTLYSKLQQLEKIKQKTLLIGVSFALLDFVESYKTKLNNTIVMETGGMKGRRKEILRDELHQILKAGFGVSDIHSEYGMTELLSQAYSKGKGIFETPPWMRIFSRNTEDPLTLQNKGTTGGLNIIDLANLNSCSFIATQDLGRVHRNGDFEVIGRFDHSDIRGCNLMAM
ncbi:acyltransferase [Croceivirga lutea]|uniref:LuxE/PaaK family acyltransferase n=1 Tax=Croceivirga lutea TaxID=1775167 RepID=UPI00163B30CD|nr:acyl transferase [Croceivirga lutea]GGG36582.1 acyltransferase [Croceivirga lutea]